MYPDLQGKRVVITGAASGIGLATARRFDPSEIREFYLSLPERMRGIYWVWLDDVYVVEAVKAGLPEDTPVVTEL